MKGFTRRDMMKLTAGTGLAVEGLPFTFASFDLLGSMSMAEVDAGRAWTLSGPPERRTAEMPMHDQVVKLY